MTASMPGYREASVPIQSEPAGGTFRRNLIWIHPAIYGIAVAIDMSTVAGYELTPSSVFLKLEPVAAAAPTACVSGDEFR